MAEETLEPFETGRLDVGDGHVLYYEQVGVREGTPVVFVHGGPGSGCTPEARRYFDLKKHRAVLFDQRAQDGAFLTPVRRACTGRASTWIITSTTSNSFENISV
jgi:pimeloyl-ACP methyl ester carboxylesterase